MKPTGRPRIEVDLAKLHELARLGCTLAEMATQVGCSRDTLERRYRQHIEAGRASGDVELRRKQFELALAGDQRMLVHLGRTRLGQVEKDAVAAEQQRVEVIVQSFFRPPNEKLPGADEQPVMLGR
jgi:AraC-like DNA-binding protein